MEELNVTERDIRAAYQSAMRDNQIRFAMVGGVLALVLLPAGVSLDYFIYPQHLRQFLFIRLACDGFIALACLFYYRPVGRAYFRSLTFTWIFSIQVALCLMIYLTDGAASPYYAGLNLVILATGVVLPLSVAEILGFSAATLLLYAVTCVVHGAMLANIAHFFNNIYFIVLTTIISATAGFFHERQRFSEFRFSYELGFRNKELAELDRLKSQFFANISHELRTPLTLILAPLEDLLSGSERLSDRIAGALGIARNNALRLLKLVNDLLDVIRLEEGYSELAREPVNIISLLRGVVESMSHLAEARDVNLSHRLPPDTYMVLGDETALEKIFFNLLSNAFKFTAPKGRIIVSTGLADGEIVVRVADTGVGIQAKDLPFVFDRFRQADESSTRRRAGTGLGLALVKEFTEAHGGHVEASSKVGSGTTISVYLPISDQNATSSALPGRSGEDDPLARIHRAAEQVSGLPLEVSEIDMEEDHIEDGDVRPLIMVVDDEPDMRRYLVDALRQDYRVVQAADGETGLQLVRQHRPAVAVLDLMMPGLDGGTVCRYIKEDSATRATKVIVLTARVEENVKLEMLRQGAEDFLTKPFSGVEVRTRIRNLIQTASLEKDLRARNQELEQTLSDLRRTESQLIQSEKLNALGSLAAGLLHEINNPLNYALTALQVAKVDPALADNEDLTDILADVDEGMQRIRSIVGDLRAFAYPSANQQADFDFGQALKSALQFTAHELRGVDVRQALDGSQMVVGSRGHIVQVLVNLLTNAAKSLHKVDDERDPRIDVAARTKGDGRLYVSVRDNGIGMTQDTLARIFDPFFTTRDVGEGMGLGLSICHTIIKNHGGELSANSEPGQGAEFTFDLPLVSGS